MKYSIAIHGGAGTILKSNMTPEMEKNYLKALKAAIAKGTEILKSGGSAVDAVMNAVMYLEDCELFNAGRGSVFTHNAQHEMDASIMNGFNLDAGAVCLLKNVKNPIFLAKEIMEKSEHVLLAGEGAEAFAKKQGLIFESDEYFNTDFRKAQLEEALIEDRIQLDHTVRNDKKFGTVGAVAMDMYGNLAAATSTGGMTNKKYNRIGDSPIIGAGTYANNLTCAISCTGHGEYFMRGIVAYDVSCLMEYKGMSLQEACHKVINEKQVNLGGEGGLIGVDKNGDVVLTFNSEGMYRAFETEASPCYAEIYG